MKATYSQIKEYGKLWEKYKPGGLMETRALQTQLNPKTGKLETTILSEEETELLIELVKEEEHLDSVQISSAEKIENEEQSIEISLKITDLLESKAELFKRETGRKLNIETLKYLFLEGCKQKEATGSKITHIKWGFAHVDNTLDTLTHCIHRDVSPNSKNFAKAEEDVQKFDLNYELNDLSQLFLDIEKKKGHNFHFYL